MDAGRSLRRHATSIRKDLEKFKPYVQEIIRAHRTDERVLFWEIHNEPPPGNKVRDQLKRAGYAWAKEVRPTQPVINCEKGRMGWADCAVSGHRRRPRLQPRARTIAPALRHQSREGTVSRKRRALEGVATELRRPDRYGLLARDDDATRANRRPACRSSAGN